MIFIDPSELRTNSKLSNYIRNLTYKSLPGLEALTGADIMISAAGMPTPRDDDMILSHIANGAKLIQVKFGHDLSSSIADDRLKIAQDRMLKTGAYPWQCMLLFVGIIREGKEGSVEINGQQTYNKRPMLWWGLDQAINYWIDRGGCYYPIYSGFLIQKHLENTQQRLNMYTNEEFRTRHVLPKPPIFHKETESEHPVLRKWKVGQKLEIIDDLRRLLCAIPSARIGQDKANSIFDYMELTEIRQDFSGFLSMLEQDETGKCELEKVKGIGKGLSSAIRWGLWRTHKERSERKDK